MGTPLTGKPVPEPVPVVEIDGHSYKLDEAALSKILCDPRVKDRPVVVVSVAGAFRKGKSFLLNIFLRYLNAKMYLDPNDPNCLGDEDSPLEGFTWRCGSERDTTGILMWSEPFIIKRGEEEVAVLLMDTQGAFDRQSTVRNSATIFALSTLLSSVQIYNLSGNIQENDLQHLQLFTEYGRLALESNNDIKPFQTLQFLVRDWSYPYEYPCGEEGGKMLLEKILQVSDNPPPELEKIRKYIRSCFQRLDCYLMPYPGEKVSENPDFDGRLKDTRPQFRMTLKSYVKHVLDESNLVVKKINGSKVTGKELLEYFIAYMKIFQWDTLPEPKSVYLATAEANNLAAVAKATDLYSTDMKNFFEDDKHGLKRDLLVRQHRHAEEMANDWFNQTRKMGDDEFIQEYAGKLKLGLKELYKKYKRELNALIERAEAGNLVAVDKAMKLYSEEMGSFFAHDKHCLKSDNLERKHMRSLEMAIYSFNQTSEIGSTEFRKPYAENLKLELEKLYNKYKVGLTLLIDCAKAGNLTAVTTATDLYTEKMDIFFAQDKHCLKRNLFAIAHKQYAENALASFNETPKMGDTEFRKSYADNLKLELAKLYKKYEDYLTELIKRADACNLIAVKKATDLYSEDMKSFFAQDKHCLKPNLLERQHRHAEEIANDWFNQTGKGDGEFIQQYAGELKLGLEELYQKCKRKLNELIKCANDGNLIAVAKAMNLYSKEMKSVFDRTKPYIEPKVLEREHKRCAGMVLDSFIKTRKLGDAEFREEYEKNLKFQLQEKYHHYVEQNCINMKEQRNKNVVKMGAAGVGGAAATVVTAAATAVSVEAPIAAVAAFIAAAPIAVAAPVVAVVGGIAAVAAAGGLVWNGVKYVASRKFRSECQNQSNSQELLE